MYGRQEFGLMKRKASKGFVWYYWVYDEDNRRVYRSTGCRTKSLALQYVLDRREKHLLGVMDRKSITFNDFCKDMYVIGKCPLEAYNNSRGRSSSVSTMRSKRIHLSKHILPYFGNLAISKITADKIDRWMINLSKEKLSNTSTNAMYATLSNILNFAKRKGIINENPCRRIEKLGNDSKRHESFTLEEIRKIIGKEEDWGNPLVRLMCATAAVTGIRVGEARALTADKVKDNYLVISDNLTMQNEVKCTKNGKTRYIPIPSYIHDELMKYAPVSGGFIFSLSRGKPLSVSAIENALKARCVEVGIKERTFHSFRVFFNTMLTSSNINETVVRSIVGHKDEKMTEHYFHLETADATMIENVQRNILE